MNTASSSSIETNKGGNGEKTQSNLSILPTPPPAIVEGLSELTIPQEAAIGVVKGSVGCSAVMGIGGMIYGALRAQPAILYGIQAGFNTFTFAFPIFAVREYVAIPVYTDLMRKQFGKDYKQSLHTQNLIPTTFAGGLMGGAMSAYFAGKQKWLAGTRTYAVLCAGLQLASNELRVVRLHFLNANQSENSRLPDVDEIGKKTTSNKASSVASSSAALSVAGLEGSSSGIETSLSLKSSPPKDVQQQEQQPSIFTKVWNKVSNLSPVQRISDEEYEAKLLRRRELTVQQLRELDERIAEEEKAQHKV